MTMCIDIHHHMLTPGLVEALDARRVRAVGGEPVPSWKPEASLAIMDQAGIERAVLSCPIPLHFLNSGAAAMARELNEFGAECVSRWPDRFGYFATLPLPDVEAAADEAARTLDNSGASGVLMLSNHAGLYQGSSVLDPLYAELNRRRAVAFIHPTVYTDTDYPIEPNAGSPIPTIQPSQLEFGFDATRAVANLLINEVPERFPAIRFVFTHSASCVPSVAHKLINRKPIVAAYAAYIKEHEQPPPVDDLLDQLAVAEAAARDADCQALLRHRVVNSLAGAGRSDVARPDITHPAGHRFSVRSGDRPAVHAARHRAPPRIQRRRPGRDSRRQR